MQGLLLGLLMLFQPTTVDTFQRANASFTTPWVVQTGLAANFIVSSNTATVSNLGVDSGYYYSGTFPNDQWASARLLNPGNTGVGTADGFGVTVRASTSAQTYYRLTCNTVTSRLTKVLTGTGTALGSSFTTCASGDILTLAAQGTTITVYKNWVSVFSITDTAITSGQPGIFYFSTDSGGAISQWWAGGFR